MSLFYDSIGLPRHVTPPLIRRFNIGDLAPRLDGLATPARALRDYLEARAKMRAARRALELSLKPKVRVVLHCKGPDGRSCIDLVM